MVKTFAKENFNAKIKSSQFDHEIQTKPEEKGNWLPIDILAETLEIDLYLSRIDQFQVASSNDMNRMISGLFLQISLLWFSQKKASNRFLIPLFTLQPLILPVCSLIVSLPLPLILSLISNNQELKPHWGWAAADLDLDKGPFSKLHKNKEVKHPISQGFRIKWLMQNRFIPLILDPLTRGIVLRGYWDIQH